VVEENKATKKPKAPKRTGGFHRKRFTKHKNTNIEFEVNEFLQLGLEEAFFLQHALHCLKLVDEDGEEITVDHAWKLFTEIEPHFKYSYASYHYYRSYGLTPKYGLKYGVDWVLYRRGPTLFHADRAIIIHVVDMETKKPLEMKPAQRSLSWLNLLNINRVSEQVKKGLVICIVHTPKMDETILSSPDVFLEQLAIQEMGMSRWVPTQTREIVDKMQGVQIKE